MKHTLQELLVECVKDGKSTDGGINPIRYPSQILCLAEQILFAERCEQAMSSNSLTEFMIELESQLDSYTNTDIQVFRILLIQEWGLFASVTSVIAELYARVLYRAARSLLNWNPKKHKMYQLRMGIKWLLLLYWYLSLELDKFRAQKSKFWTKSKFLAALIMPSIWKKKEREREQVQTL